MPVRVFAAAVLVLSTANITGYSAKLPAADTCSYVLDKAAKSGLGENLAAANRAMVSGDYGMAIKPYRDYASLLSKAADDSSDEQLATSLRAVAGWSDRIASIMEDESLDRTSKGKQLTEQMLSAEFQEQSRSLYRVCPGIEELG